MLCESRRKLPINQFKVKLVAKLCNAWENFA